MALSPLALSYISGVIGTPYGYLTTSTIPDEQPAWAKNGAPPSASYVKARSSYCAGVPNLMLRAAGWAIPHSGQSDLATRYAYDGGTLAYYNYYLNRGVMRNFSLSDASQWHGMLVGREYVSASNPGHVAVVLLWSPSQQKWGYYSDSVAYVVESTSYSGVSWNSTLSDSHYYNKYTYSVIPDNFCPTK